MTLNQLNHGQHATIRHFDRAQLEFSQYCSDLGITAGANVQLMRRAPGQGPLQIKVLGTLYAIRPDDAETIEVSAI